MEAPMLFRLEAMGILMGVECSAGMLRSVTGRAKNSQHLGNVPGGLNGLPFKEIPNQSRPKAGNILVATNRRNDMRLAWL
jgi:hypothetical protein